MLLFVEFYHLDEWNTELWSETMRTNFDSNASSWGLGIERILLDGYLLDAAAKRIAGFLSKVKTNTTEKIQNLR